MPLVEFIRLSPNHDEERDGPWVLEVAARSSCGMHGFAITALGVTMDPSSLGGYTTIDHASGAMRLEYPLERFPEDGVVGIAIDNLGSISPFISAD